MLINARISKAALQAASTLLLPRGVFSSAALSCFGWLAANGRQLISQSRGSRLAVTTRLYLSLQMQPAVAAFAAINPAQCPCSQPISHCSLGSSSSHPLPPLYNCNCHLYIHMQKCVYIWLYVCAGVYKNMLFVFTDVNPRGCWWQSTCRKVVRQCDFRHCTP